MSVDSAIVSGPNELTEYTNADYQLTATDSGGNGTDWFKVNPDGSLGGFVMWIAEDQTGDYPYHAGDEGQDKLQFAVYDGSGSCSGGSCGSGYSDPPTYSNELDITIDDGQLTFEPFKTPATAIEGDTGTAIALGVVLDTNPSAQSDDYDGSQVTWPDGSTSNAIFAGTRTDADGNPVPSDMSAYEVLATNDNGSLEEGTQNVTVAINDDGGESASGTAPVKVNDAPIHVAVTGPAGAVEGQPLTNVVVGQVTDDNPKAPLSDLSGTIDWGDGPGGDDGTSTSAATFQPVSGQPGVYNILGTHTYKEEGGYDMVITVNDKGGSSDVSSGMFTIGDASIYLSPAVQVRGTEGQSTGLITVATIQDTNPNAGLDDFPPANVTINWGDGNSSNATLVAQGNGSFLVQGSNAYAEEGPYTVTINATDKGGSTAKPAQTYADIQDAALHLAWANVGFIEGQPVGNQTIATLTDDNPNAPVSDFVGFVNFGDGTSGALNFTPLGGGRFSVGVPQEYLEEGNYGLSIQVRDVGGPYATASASAATIAQVADAPLDAVWGDSITTPGTSFFGTIANFTDIDRNGSITDGDGYYATIDWGDSTGLNTAVLAPGSGGSWNVLGTHTYANPGIYTLTVTMVDGGGASTTAKPRIAAVPNMQVATINHNAVSGHLTHAQETSPGAFVPLDNNDWDYDGTLDMLQTGPVPGDQYLLPVTLPALTGATSNDGYTLTASSGIKIYLGSDRSSPYTGQVLPAIADQTVYLEGVQAGGVNAAETLTENFSLDQTSKSNLDSAKVIVFTMQGPIDVPGTATYDYTSDLTTGSWSTPDGGTIKGGNNTAGPRGSDAQINWNNSPQVGYALYAVNASYAWGVGVNVVQINIAASGNSAHYANPATQPPVQSGGPGTALIQSNSALDAMTADIYVDSIVGPTVNGHQRGLKFIQIGLVHEAQFRAKEGLFNNATPKVARVSSLQDGLVHFDAAVQSTLPWVFQDTESYLDVTSDSTPVTSVHFHAFDNPSVLATDTLSLNGTQVNAFALDFRHWVYLAVRSKDPLAGSQLTERAVLNWDANIGGSLDATLAYTPTGSGVTGDSAFQQVTDGSVVPTAAANINESFGSESWQTVNQ